MIIEYPLKPKEYPLKCIAGDDAFLMYYYLCDSCETIVAEDNSEESLSENAECPSCKPQENFKFKYFTKKQIMELDVGVPSVGVDEDGNFIRREMSLVDRLKIGLI